MNKYLLVTIASFLILFCICGSEPQPNTPKSALETISGTLTWIGMDYDETKLKTSFSYLALLVKDEAFFQLIYELKQKDYENTRFYIKNVSEIKDNQAEAVVQIQWEQKNTTVGFSQRKIQTNVYHFTLNKFQDGNGVVYWAITKATEGVI